MPATVVWLRLDLRLADHPALHAAIRRGGPVIPLFCHAPEEEAPWEPGAASRWWLHQSLRALDASLQERGSRLILRRGPSLETLLAVAKETGAKAILWSHRYEPAMTARDAKIKEALRTIGLEAESFNAALLHEPWTVQNLGGKPFQVFTPFWKHCLAKPDPPEPLPAPGRLPAPKAWPSSLDLAGLELEPKIAWADGLRATWQPGEAGAQARLQRFVAAALAAYSADRDRPDLAGTSRLSPHLHFGEISPRQIWHALRRADDSRDEPAKAPQDGAGSPAPRLDAAASRGSPARAWRTSRFLAEVGWREFAHHLLYHFPHTPTAPLRPEFTRFPWRQEAGWLKAWQKGRTGFPIVDAGMRELWATGWMHNRVRMIVASFLVKDLLITWQEGARWFWDTLVDADLAQNTLGWQWSAGCGADAAPFFRVFNPVSQGEKFDPHGAYVRRWCPELAKLPDAWIHQPDKAPRETLDRAAIEIGRTYPRPIVSHAIARQIALEAFASLKGR
ncbi:MAG TPA: deoxyribodipyrimidine photo-lyase [Methylomirabilota bacterium]|nr:deoxyribodipyrimidine photo-lyase [Methylomirabilota bacterium]